MGEVGGECTKAFQQEPQEQTCLEQPRRQKAEEEHQGGAMQKKTQERALKIHTAAEQIDL